MHELRASLAIDEEAHVARLLAKKKGSQAGEAVSASLLKVAVPRAQSRSCDQRSEARQRDLVDQAVVHFRRRAIDVAVVNVSQSGVMIEGAISPEIGERIEIQFAGCNRTRGVVRWVRGPRIGVEFPNETIVLSALKSSERTPGAITTPAGPIEQVQPIRSRARRMGLVWRGTLYWSYEAFSVKLHNISSEGAMLEGEADLPEGAKVRLNLAESGTLDGEVRWCRSGHIGIRFDEPFNVKLLANSRGSSTEPAGHACYPDPRNRSVPPPKPQKRSIWRIGR